MKLFQTTLRDLMALHAPPLSQQDLADLTGISHSTISRILAGREPLPKQVGKLCAVISIERSVRVQLLIAWLRDLVEYAKPAGLDERHVRICSADDETDSVAGTLGAELSLIAEECVLHEDVRAVITDLARMIMRHRAELADRVVPYPVSDDNPETGKVADDPEDEQR